MKQPFIPDYINTYISTIVLHAAYKRLRQPPSSKTYVFSMKDIPGHVVTIIATHDATMGQWNKTRLGQGKTLGGFRIIPLSVLPGLARKEKLKNAKLQAQALSRDMTYKWILFHRMLADMKFRGIGIKQYEILSALMGGAKTISVFETLDDYFGLGSKKHRSFIYQYAKKIDSFQGAMNTAPDMYTNFVDMDLIGEKTKWVNSTTKTGGSGDPSPITAAGVWYGAEALIEELNLKRPTFAIQGVGKVGSLIAEHIFRKYPKTTMYFCDPQPKSASLFLKKFNRRKIIRLNHTDYKIYQCADVFMPCAIPKIINNKTIPLFINGPTKLIVGAANDQYETDKYSNPKKRLIDKLHHGGVVVATSWVVNGGGIANISTEFHKLFGGPRPNLKRARQLIAGVDSLSRQIFHHSKKNNIPYEKASEEIVYKTYAAFCQANGIFN